MAPELVDLVDNRDRVVGYATVDRCLAEGLLHRAVAVLVVRKSGRYVLQRRSFGDIWHPGLWTLSSTGHVKKGEGYLAAARRELKEELGIEGRLTLVRRYRMPPISDKGLTEHEWVSLYACRSDSPCSIDRAELEAVKDVTVRELRGMVRGGPLTPDARLILSDYLDRGS